LQDFLDRLNVLDLIIAILMQHEKKLDKNLAVLENLIERVEYSKAYSDSPLSRVYFNSQKQPRVSIQMSRKTIPELNKYEKKNLK
jgi:hypothetical protein